MPHPEPDRKGAQQYKLRNDGQGECACAGKARALLPKVPARMSFWNANRNGLKCLLDFCTYVLSVWIGFSLTPSTGPVIILPSIFQYVFIQPWLTEKTSFLYAKWTTNC